MPLDPPWLVHRRPGSALPIQTEAARRILRSGNLRDELLKHGTQPVLRLGDVDLVDGWLHTGDVGEIGQDGTLAIRGRIKELIISGGFNVYPREVELVLEQHPAVAEVAVVGMPSTAGAKRRRLLSSGVRL